MPDLGHDKESQAGTGSGAAPRSRLSRRQVMTASAVVAGVGLASVPARAEAGTGGQAVSLGEPGTTTVEFRGRVIQSGSSGQSFTSFGYLIRASHADDSGLFDGTPLSEATALLTAYATGDLQARTVDMSVHALDIVGTMTVYQRKQPGASFNNPSSFQVGTPVARYDMTLQDVLTVFATDTGLPTLTGDMLQTAAHALSGPLAGQTFGRPGTRLRFFATGLGHRTDTAPNAQLEIAGNWSIE
ncbi:MAG TPA: hypothetical protein VEH31_12710 [Streptosporangiaceae bacterium]|nr:hypothetical protein [Streptosporangiaceae bacterium]